MFSKVEGAIRRLKDEEEFNKSLKKNPYKHTKLLLKELEKLLTIADKSKALNTLKELVNDIKEA